jgi:leucyl-tRNA synthetase
MDSTYKPQEIEPKWQRHWEKTGLYATTEEGGKPKYYCLDFFPYPSGDGLHVGHCRNYIPTDVLSRFMRMRGYNVLHPMGWDAFGEPTEQAAVRHQIHPRETTDRNTANFKRQMKLIGTSYDWSREIDSSSPSFYRWTQWFFLLLYRRGLAYRDTNWQWWCPICQTTMSSHEVEGGVCWRGHDGIIKREIPAWYFKITAYADELLVSLEKIDWPERIKTIQRKWIGRSEGTVIHFQSGDGQVIPVFTTRPDTVFGATFFVMAPEHPLVSELTMEEKKAEVEAYTHQAARLSEVERTSVEREKTGVFTGGYVVNPMNAERIPVWIADYVLPTYGSGALMAVPAHDQRDFEFAMKFNLPVTVVITPPDYTGEILTEAYTGDGTMINSQSFNGLPNREGADRLIETMEERSIGHAAVNYRMHDWLISRQRYWGAPIPIVYCSECGEVPVPEDQLPVLLPEMDDFTPDGTGRSPLARVPEFLNTDCPTCGGPAQRESDTMGGFACSSWYFLRFTSPDHHDSAFEPVAMRYWSPPDLYVGGAEHAVLHLLYARFWVKVMADAGLVPFREPFPRLLNQGILHAPDGRRMSKSRENVITPDETVAEFSADALRVYGMFMAPFDQDVGWNQEGINGAWRFLNRTWRLYVDNYAASAKATIEDPELERLLQKTIQGVTIRIENLRFNTMVSILMEFVNALVERQQRGASHTVTFHQALETLVVLLAPACPHITEELWFQTGHQGSVHQQPWPGWDDVLLQEEVVAIAVQVNGKMREVVKVPVEWDQNQVQEQAISLPGVLRNIENQEVTKVIYVPGKVLNLVTKRK